MVAAGKAASEHDQTEYIHLPCCRIGNGNSRKNKRRINGCSPRLVRIFCRTTHLFIPNLRLSSIPVHRQLLHTVRDRLHRRSRVKLAQGNAAVLVLGRQLLPLLHGQHAGSLDGFVRIRHGLAGGHVPNLDKRHGDETGAAQATDGFGHKPLLVGDGADDDGLAGFGLQLVGPLGVEIVHYDSVHHGALASGDGGHPETGAFPGGVGRVLVIGATAVGKARIVRLLLGRLGRTSAVSLGLLGLSNHLEKRDGHEAAGGGDEGIARFVPVGIVFSADDVEEIALAKGQFLRVSRIRLVIV